VWAIVYALISLIGVADITARTKVGLRSVSILIGQQITPVIIATIIRQQIGAHRWIAILAWQEIGCCRR
jgi:hypothetical protein